MKKIAFIIALFLPLFASAQTYQPLVTLPGVTTGDFNSYINSVYALSISIAALLAVIKIVVAGVKWMTTDVVTSKGDAKRDIQGALIGLLIVLSAVLIITVINPNITNVNFSLNSVSAPTYVAPGTVSLTTPVTNNGVYTSIPASDLNQVAAFEATCSVPPQTFRVEGSLARCYNTAAGEVVNTYPICGSGNSCNSQQLSMAIESCQGSVTLGTSGKGSGGQGSQTFVVDPSNSNTAICIYVP